MVLMTTIYRFKTSNNAETDIQTKNKQNKLITVKNSSDNLKQYLFFLLNILVIKNSKLIG
jgi:hypothetical protein